ncbi:MAG: hypothetical protein H7Z13_13880 [Ferruginibacter sp.]|nr:hypothetical protein [Ferruginibacter sp.]
MNLQGSLRIEYNGETYGLMVKTFVKNGTYYFFVSDKEKGKSLLAGESLELTYSDSFCSAEENSVADNKKIPPEIVSAIEKMLLENKQLWFY